MGLAKSTSVTKRLTFETMMRGTTEAWQNQSISMGAMGLSISVNPAKKHTRNDAAPTVLPSDLTLRPAMHFIIIQSNIQSIIQSKAVSGNHQFRQGIAIQSKSSIYLLSFATGSESVSRQLDIIHSNVYFYFILKFNLKKFKCGEI